MQQKKKKHVHGKTTQWLLCVASYEEQLHAAAQLWQRAAVYLGCVAVVRFGALQQLALVNCSAAANWVRLEVVAFAGCFCATAAAEAWSWANFHFLLQKIEKNNQTF